MTSEVRILPQITPEQAAKVNAALEKRNEADYQCFLLLRTVKQWVGQKPDRDERGEVQELKTLIEEAILKREQANDAFLRAYLG